jgi:general L-amino acid transport system substrate-binding protein
VLAALDSSARWLDNALVLHSLSKRSSAAGLRSGLAVGAQEVLAALNRVRLNGTACTPLPLLAAATALWSEDTHVAAMRGRLSRRKDVADRLLGGYAGYYRACGFSSGAGRRRVAVTQRLARFALLRAYLTQPDGRRQCRGAFSIALVHDPKPPRRAVAGGSSAGAVSPAGLAGQGAPETLRQAAGVLNPATENSSRIPAHPKEDDMTKKLAIAAALLAMFAGNAQAGKTLDTIKQKDVLVCGVNPSLPGFSAADSQGTWGGLDVDVCRAFAATILGDAKKVKWVPLNASQRFTALQSGEIDVLVRNTTWTLTRDASLGLEFTGVTYYDGQGFMVPKKSKVTSAKQLKGATVCVQSGTTTEKNLSDFSKSNNLAMKPVVFETQEATNKAYFSGRCQAYTTDASGLASVRNKEAGNPEDHVILPDLISKEPLGPSVRRGDDEYFTIVKWVVFALIEAEEYGITQENVDAMRLSSKDPVVQRILGTSEDTGKLLGLDKDWAYRAIKAVGNYGEIFERNVGPKSALKLPRGANNLWSKGGLQYAPPIR